MPDDDNKPQPVITNDIRRAWNDYITWLRDKGVAGTSALDTKNVGNSYLTQYIKENPNTPLTPNIIAPLQQDFLKYKDYALNQVKNGRAVFQQGVDENNFMNDLSKEDGWAGSETTKHKFPIEYLTYLENNQPKETIQKGFATVNQ